MSDAAAAPLLPLPERTRWQPLRLGLTELYHYDVEEFWFRDGHLLLRGNNGTGKSKVLSLTLPFLLDANLSASRVEPDGDRSKRMEWNLLMNRRHERRVGYTWIEFGRRDDAGRVFTLTLGCGLRAVAGRPNADHWFFVTEQRIGADLWLTTPEKTALSRERLIEAIGAHGQVFSTAQAYRRAVDEKLFRLGTERYDALVDTLIQLRQPQLSKNPDEGRLSEALTHALRPLDRAALEDVAEAMNELDDIRRDLAEIEALRKAIGLFGTRYRRYAQVATRRRARTLRQSQTEFDNTSRDLNAAQTELDAAKVRVARHQATQQQLDEGLAAADARLRVLREDPVMRDAARLSGARERAEECRGLLEEAATRETRADALLSQETQYTGRRRLQADTTRAELEDATTAAADFAAHTGLGDRHARAVQDLVLPDGVSGLAADAPAVLLRAARDAEAHRREQIAVIRKRLRERETAAQLRSRAQDNRNLYADAFDAASDAARGAAGALLQGRGELREAWRLHAGALQALHLGDVDALLDEFDDWSATLNGTQPLRGALERARHLLEQTLAARAAELDAERRRLTRERHELDAERRRLEAGEDRPPPVPHTRDAALRSGASGAPLWQLVDFSPRVPSTARAGLEAALEAAGLLDAWVLPEGILLAAGSNDVVLTLRPPRQDSLAEWLVPTIPADGSGACIDAPTLTALLRAVACGEQEPGDAEAWVSPVGEFRVGNLRGAWSKPEAEYLGYAAREAARRARLAGIADLLEQLRVEIAACEAAATQLVVRRAQVQDDVDRAPTDDGLLRLHARHDAAEQRRRDDQTRLGAAEAQLAQTDHALARARDELELDARDLSLPADAGDLDRIDSSLVNYRVAVTNLVNALRRHQAALAELTAQALRESAARDALQAARDDHRHKHTLLSAAAETVATLEATVGKQVSELLGAIAATQKTQQAQQSALKEAINQLLQATAQRGTAEQKHAELERKLDDRSHARRSAAETLHAFTVHSGFVNIAVPDLALPESAAPWSVEAALTVARRAEQALDDVPAEDADWQRIQGEIGRDFTELQSTMSAQGHSAAAEPSDHGLIVRIVYQQQLARPDLLQQRLDGELAEQRLILSAQESALLEEHLEKEIAANLQRMIRDTEERVASINVELEKRPTSTGMCYRLVWQPLPEKDENAVPGLDVARKRLLNTNADAWSAADRTQVGGFLQARIDAERQRDEHGTLFDSLSRALDYRRWHRFTVERRQDRQWKPLSGPASSGERALGLTVPLFAAASSHYESADPHAPRLVLLDEAFAGIDDEARASCMGLIREFDLDFVMTSEREWGCYAEISGLNICQLVRREGMDAVFVSRWSWNGRERREEADQVRRFPAPPATAA